MPITDCNSGDRLQRLKRRVIAKLFMHAMHALLILFSQASAHVWENSETLATGRSQNKTLQIDRWEWVVGSQEGGVIMLYLLTVIIYASVFLFSLWFYSTYFGARAIYRGAGAIVIDLCAIGAGLYAICFSYLSYARGVGLEFVLGTITVGAVVSAMHLAKWVIRHRVFAGVDLHQRHPIRLDLR